MTEIVDQPDLVRGDSRTIKVTLQDAAAAPIDITGDLLTITLKVSEDDVDPGALQVKETVLAGADATNGIGYLKLVATATDGLTPNSKYFYDVQWVRKSVSPEEVYTLSKGKIKILPDVTRDVV